MHEAKTRLSELVRAVEEQHETVVICRGGTPVVELKAVRSRKVDRLTPDPALKPIAIKYDPTEPLTEEDWPADSR